MNLVKVEKISIGFGDGNNPDPNAGGGTVYFDDIILLCGNAEAPEIPETPYDGAPVYLDEDPFYYGWGNWPYLIKQDCPLIGGGYGYIDEYPELLGKTDSFEGVPDEGVVDIGFHYINWHFSNAPSGEPLKADLDNSMKVDFKDFAILANYWQKSTTGEADLDGSGFVDYNDLSLFAEEWQAERGMYIEGFSLDDTLQPMDFNNVSGYAGIVPRNIPLEAGEIFVYVDDVQIGSWIRGWDSENKWFGFESDKFSNGWHTIRLVTTDVYGGIINHRPINVYFNNLLYKVSGGDYFHPDESYKYSAFYDGSSTLEAVLTDHDGQTIWSNNYTGQYISIVILGATFGSEHFCELSITEGTKSGGSTVTKKDLTKKFKQADCPAGVKMVIVLPNKDVFKVRKPAIIECAEACNNRNVTWVSLYHHDVTEDNLTFLYNKSSIKYIYWCGHANSHVGAEPDKEGANQFYKVIEDPSIHGVGGVARTHTECWRYEKSGWWDIISNWHKIGVFSFTKQTHPDAYPLPDDWDNRGFDLCSLGMQEEGNKKIVFVDGCWSALYDDMAYAYGMYSLWNAGHHDQIYIGWRCLVLTAAPGSIFDWVLFSTDGVKLFWERMGAGDDVYEALSYTASFGGGGVQTTLWGLNGMMDFDEPYEDSDDNIWMYGEGIHAELEP